jgi:hypothetical protein
VGLKIEGVDLLMRSLRQVQQRAVRGGADALREGGEEIAKLARDFAPIDDGDLTQAISAEEERDVNNRVSILIWVDPTVQDEHGKQVAEYGARMHEGLAPYGSGAYNLGPNSRAKDGGRGIVGGKFIERALRIKSGVIGKKLAGLLRRRG